MKKFAVVLTLVLAGCAPGKAYVNTYRAAIITKDVVTEAHQLLWSDPLREKVKECDEAIPDNAGVEALELCLAPYTKEANDKVVAALAAYRTAAQATSTILIAAEQNPDGIDKEALSKSIKATIAAADELVSLFPKGKKWRDKLTMLLKGLI